MIRDKQPSRWPPTTWVVAPGGGRRQTAQTVSAWISNARDEPIVAPLPALAPAEAEAEKTFYSGAISPWFGHAGLPI
ncbi:MAG: hypothetical protein JWR00_4226 [Rubritepida sp.]|nr:hypothetical protein [Rubritepida sp.]